MQIGDLGRRIYAPDTTAATVEDTDIEAARSLSHPAAEQPELGLRKPESTHRWTAVTCRASGTSLACSDWCKIRIMMSDGQNWPGSKAMDPAVSLQPPGRCAAAGRARWAADPRCAIAGVLAVSAVTALATSLRSILPYYRDSSTDIRHANASLCQEKRYNKYSLCSAKFSGMSCKKKMKAVCV